MKKFNFHLLSILILLLAACGNTENSSTEENTSELTELEEENEELREQLQEQDSEEVHEGVQIEESDDGAETIDATEGSEKNNDQNDSSESIRSELIFDINSPEVQSQFIGTDNINDEGYFEQDAITVGMSQTEIEEKYGPYDFTLQAGGSAPAFYGNLAMIYSEFAPYGDGEDASDSSINPDENYVEAVYYYAGITENELIEAWGEPEEARTRGPALVYRGEGDDGNYYVTLAGSSMTPEGKLVSIIQRNIHAENPNDSGQSTDNDDAATTDDPDPSAETKDEAD